MSFVFPKPKDSGGPALIKQYDNGGNLEAGFPFSLGN